MVTIRDYNPQDAAQLVQCIIELQSFEAAIEPNRSDGRKIAPAYRERLLSECQRRQGKILVAEVDGGVVAFTCVLTRVDAEDMIEMYPEYAYLTDLVVLPAYRGRGIGRALLQYAEEYALAKGAAVLKVDVLAANTIARELYTRAGYQENEVRLQKQLQPVNQPAA